MGNALRKEYIQSIKFFNRQDEIVEAYAFGWRICKCVVKTNFSSRIFKISDICGNYTDSYLLDENFKEIEHQKFIGARLFRVVKNVNKLKKDKKFLDHFNQLERICRQNNFQIRYTKFETLKGIFYVVLAFDNVLSN